MEQGGIINKKTLSVFSLTMITIGAVDSVRNLPVTALFGSSLIFFYLLSAVFFLLPSAMVSAELSTSLPKQGGIYAWAEQAFGLKTAYCAIWFQWIENIIWYPIIISFIAGTIAEVLSPSLSNNHGFLFLLTLVICWSVTLINFRGMQSSAWVSSFCSITGLILPMTVVILAGFFWFLHGNPLQVKFGWHDIIPNVSNPSVWVSLTGVVLSLCGMEIATVHANEVKDPQRAFPKALLYSSLIIIVTLVLGSLAIAVVLPRNEISLVAGIMQAFYAFFRAYHVAWLVPVIGVLLVLGALGQMNNWIIAPAKGLLFAARDSTLPLFFQKTNRKGVPVNLLIIQTIIISLLASIFLFLPSVNESYWLLSALASQIYMLMYLIMFAASIYLRFKHPDLARPYQVPGGKYGIIIVGGMGMLAAVLTIVVGFFPPPELHITHLFHYEALLLGGLLLMVSPPLFMRGKGYRPV